MKRRLKLSKKKPLTPSEAKAYTAAKFLIESTYIAPSQAEVAAKAGLSIPQASRLLNSLINKGWLKTEPGKYRSLQLPEVA